ncbi:hypothetical protein TNCV_4303461 [Trichonephila clavipes]|nr:hypothetical protein TNCV_4303461 [Trichonephila clavipes]
MLESSFERKEPTLQMFNWRSRQDLKISSKLQKIPEGSELANMVANDAKLATNLVTQNDANLALPPSSH